MVLTHVLDSWITNPITDHVCAVQCGAADPRVEWLLSYSDLPGLLSTAENKPCCAQLVTECLKHIWGKNQPLHCSVWELALELRKQETAPLVSPAERDQGTALPWSSPQETRADVNKP